MTHQLRRTAVTAAAFSLAATAVLAGCSSDDSSEKDGPPGKRDGRSTSQAAPPSQAPLGRAALKKALLREGDVKGVDVEPLPGDEAEAKLALAAGGARPAVCSPLVHMAAHTSVPAPKSRGAVTTSREDGLVTSVGLMGHEAADAARIVAALRTAVEKCGDGFKDEVGSYRGLAALPDPAQGDEGVSYRLKSTMDGETVPLTFTVIRSGGTLAVFFGTNLVEPDRTKPAPEVVRAQLAKLPG
ncbi:hypothetical protein FM076_02310 [Streptomyces albus subsp. chlorinus]|uniref:hypothetical protein n=1 Tax=Streptomyces albus TaxID=1888 RepID=UPI00156D82A6|nr:hypothetical protein [Streptomyces albus]NSC20102.1 hypothetical protein [Streptomyces albus subsp. chlorinus]